MSSLGIFRFTLRSCFLFSNNGLEVNFSVHFGLPFFLLQFIVGRETVREEGWKSFFVRAVKDFQLYNAKQFLPLFNIYLLQIKPRDALPLKL